MPIAYIDVPSSLSVAKRKQLVSEVAASIHRAYRIGDTRVFLRPWAPDDTSVDGALGAGVRPICTFVVPPGLPDAHKRGLVEAVSASIVRACDLGREKVPLPSGKTVETHWVLSFFSEYTLDRAALDGMMAFENPMVLESMEAQR
jgi:phenylpyruvate tautomerase PptA (4-oxalocrotonate tautomerase family)